MSDTGNDGVQYDTFYAPGPGAIEAQIEAEAIRRECSLLDWLQASGFEPVQESMRDWFESRNVRVVFDDTEVIV